MIDFDWGSRDEGLIIAGDVNFDFDTIDIPAKCKLLSAIVRNDRFCEGALVSAFKSGQVPKMLKSITKQYEVKAISTNNKNKSFIINRNELKKSKSLNNYYIYCVTGVESDEPSIIRLKHQDFDNPDNFQAEPLKYRVIFE